MAPLKYNTIFYVFFFVAPLYIPNISVSKTTSRDPIRNFTRDFRFSAICSEIYSETLPERILQEILQMILLKRFFFGEDSILENPFEILQFFTNLFLIIHGYFWKFLGDCFDLEGLWKDCAYHKFHKEFFYKSGMNCLRNSSKNFLRNQVE